MKKAKAMVHELDTKTTIAVTRALLEKIRAQKASPSEPNEDVLWRWYRADERLKMLEAKARESLRKTQEAGRPSGGKEK